MYNVVANESSTFVRQVSLGPFLQIKIQTTSSEIVCKGNITCRNITLIVEIIVALLYKLINYQDC